MNEGMLTPWSSRPWRRVAVVGMGISGRAAASLLLHRGVEVIGFDRRAAEELDLGPLGEAPGLSLRADSAELPAALDAVVVSPGVPNGHPFLGAARRADLPVIAEVELAFPLLDGPVVAITGSNGKSTTTGMTGAMLEAAGRSVEVCGNIGRALSSVVEGDPGRIFVVELSSFQLENTRTFRPRAAALLNLASDHLDRHGSLEEYGRLKASLFQAQQDEDLAVLNAGDTWVAAVEPPARRRFFHSAAPVADGCWIHEDQVLEMRPGLDRPELLFHLDQVPLPGPHNVENAMAAALLARHLGATPEQIGRGLESFQGLPHRLERVREKGGVTWYNDSKGTNIAATLGSLGGFADGSVHLILGGQFKGGDLEPLVQRVAAKAVRVYLIGEAAPTFARALGDSVPSEHAGTLDRAVASAEANAETGQVVLLSPACASFDQFTNFAERGRVFKQMVHQLGTGSTPSPRSAKGGSIGTQAGV